MMLEDKRQALIAATHRAAAELAELAELDCRPFARALAFLMERAPRVGDANLVAATREAARLLHLRSRLDATRYLCASGVGEPDAKYAAWLLDGGFPMHLPGPAPLPSRTDVYSEPVGSVGD